ncbi:MAG TPA: RDD family protein [Asanoa sp.]
MTLSGSRVPKQARPFQGRHAGVATRVVAGGLDALVLLALLAGSYAVWAAVVFLWNPPAFRLPAPSRALVLGAAYLVCITYLTVCWRISGRTYGDQVIGLRVVGRGGRPLGLAAALARAAVCAAFPLGLLWTAVSRENLSVADVLMRTSVVYDWQSINGAAWP